MPRETYEFDISPEQVAGLVTHASDLQGTADIIEGQIAGFLDKIIGDVGGAADLGRIGRGNYDVGTGGPGDAGLNQNIRIPKGRRAVYGVGLFKQGIGGGWASDNPEARRNANIAIANYNAAVDNLRLARGSRQRGDAQHKEQAEWDAAVPIVTTAVNSGSTVGPGGLTPSAVTVWVPARVSQPDPNGDNASSGSFGPIEHLWQSLDRLRTGGGLVEPMDSGGVGSLGVRTPAIFHANDPSDESESSSGGSIFWWGSQLVDPNPEG